MVPACKLQSTGQRVQVVTRGRLASDMQRIRLHQGSTGRDVDHKHQAGAVMRRGLARRGAGRGGQAGDRDDPLQASNLRVPPRGSRLAGRAPVGAGFLEAKIAANCDSSSRQKQWH